MLSKKKTIQKQHDQAKKKAHKQQLKSRKEAVAEYLCVNADDLISYREYLNNTVSALVSDGHKYWFIVTENGEQTDWDVVPL